VLAAIDTRGAVSMEKQLSIFDFIPHVVEIPHKNPVHDKSWGKKETAPEQCDSVREQVAVNTFSSLESDCTICATVSNKTSKTIQEIGNVHPESNRLADVSPQPPLMHSQSVREQQALPSATIPKNVNGKQQPEKQDKSNHWVEPYWVKRGNKKHEYYRYCWMIGRKIYRRHIGPIHLTDAKEKQREIRQMIIDGCTSQEITDYLDI
jgi:hypothetical protein